MNNTMTARQRDAFDILVQSVGIAGVVAALRQSVERRANGFTIPIDHPHRKRILECWIEFLGGLDGASEAASEIEKLERSV